VRTETVLVMNLISFQGGTSEVFIEYFTMSFLWSEIIVYIHLSKINCRITIYYLSFGRKNAELSAFI